MKIEAFHQVGLSVSDLDAAVAFYRDVLTLPLIARFDAGIKLAFFDIVGTRLMLEESALAQNGSPIYLQVADIDAAVAEVESMGVEIISRPHAVHHDADGTFGPPGESEFMAFLKDPSGNVVSLTQRKSHEHAEVKP